MKNYLSLENCQQLKKWGCKYLTTEVWNDGEFSHYGIDLRDIICDGELAKKFFGKKESYISFVTCGLAAMLRNNKKDSAEECLMRNTIFNPKNK